MSGAPPPPPRRRPYWTIPALLVLLALPGQTGLLVAGAVFALVAGARGWRALVRSRRAVLVAGEPGAVTLGHGRTPTSGAGREAGAPVVLSERQLAAHGLVLGATGAGKTTSLLRILSEQIRAGRPVVAIDLKGSPAFERALRQSCAGAGRPLRVWRPDGPEHWNPLAHGNATELKDKLIGAERFSEPHYQRQAERYLQLALGVLLARAPGRRPTLADVVDTCEPRRLARLAAELPAGHAAQIADYVARLGPDGTSAARGMGTRLALLAESHAGRFLGSEGIDLRRALEGGAVVLFSLNSSSLGTLAAQLGTLAVQDLVAASGERLRGVGGAPPLATVAIDEFSALRGDQVLALLARGRESAISVLLATQEFADLDRAAPGFRQQVEGNTAVKLIHRQEVPASAREAAQLAGSTQVWEETRRVGGTPLASGQYRGTRRLVEQPLVHPDRIAALRTGEALLITRVPRSEVRIVRVDPAPGAPSAGRSGPGRGSEGQAAPGVTR